MDTLWPSLFPVAALGVPLTFALAGVAAPRRAAPASGTAFALALLFALGTFRAEAGPLLGVRCDFATRIMLLLVAALGAVVVRFSRTYLDGERELDRYLRWVMLTLSAVTVLVISNSLLVISVAWTATSLALHQLLTFYSDRPAALVAAHKKFLVSRLADGALAVALGLLYTNVGSFDLDRVAAWVHVQPQLPMTMQVGACLLVAAVALRSAQLPFHGWITQVMEAPTPVSALMHAGVVNIGGFVLIRAAAWMTHAEPARLLLVTVGLLTAIVAALVMTTRVSVKVALAWSTCAQMGFMLVQCGLGLWSLALLHIVAHSIYKAYAFLSAGAAVEEWKASSFATKSTMPSPLRMVSSTIAALGVALLVLIVLRPSLGLAPLQGPSSLALTLILGLSLVPLMAARPPAHVSVAAMRALQVAGVGLLYGGWHALAEHMFPAEGAMTNTIGWWMTGVGFIGLFALKSTLQRRPSGALARRLHPWLFSGLYLDELFTRVTFRLWPPRLGRPTAVASAVLCAPTPGEVQS